MSKRTKGTCKYCSKTYTQKPMVKHILSCEARHQEMTRGNKRQQTAGCFMLLISGTYRSQYWLIAEVKDTASLQDLDQFLRDIWLECCGHLSVFNIEGERYESHPEASLDWGLPARSMTSKLVEVIRPGMVFGYEYDFGSTTALTISVLEQGRGQANRDKVTVISRNHPVEYVCDECEEKTASMICLECACMGPGFLCDDCQEDHECGEELLSPLYNSPRSGVCGYEGSIKYPD